MSSIVIGHNEQNKSVALDLDVLIKTRLLVQANSGGGKSYALRRILEQAFGKVQAIVIDPAGEFATLREKFGYVLVGKGGETPADIRSAGLVAEKLLELRASAVCDLYGLKPHERPLWVKKFLSATMNVPKKLWHPVLLIVDEAHKFVPEKGEGESEAKPEMLELASDGRKYGFCAIFATQRLAKLDKSAAAELLNVLIGPTFIDIDLERAHKALGIVRADWRDFDAQMKTAAPGQFWALGRAISTDRVFVRIARIQTTHPEAGSGKHAAEPPPAPEKVRALLPKLADLPQAAEEQARSMAELKKEIRTLKAQIRQRPRIEGVIDIDQSSIDKSVKLWQDRAALEAKRHLDHSEKFRRALEEVMKFVVQVEAEMPKMAEEVIDQQAMKRAVEEAAARAVDRVRREIEQRIHATEKRRASLKQQLSRTKKLLEELSDGEVKLNVRVVERPPSRPVIITEREPASFDPTLPPAPERNENVSEGLTGPEQRIIDAIAWQNSIGVGEPTTIAVAVTARYAVGTGGFNNARGSCRTKGLVEYRGDRMVLTDAGKQLAHVPKEDLTTTELHRRVLSVLKNPEQRILKPLLEAYPRALHDDELAPLANYKPGVGGFNNPKGRLRTLGLIEYPQPRHSVASKVLFFE
jgi:hypothetical protein